MRFSQWVYERPDYTELKKQLNGLKTRIRDAASYEELREAWLAVKAECEYMEFQEEIAYVRHLCGMDYENSTEEVKIQNMEDPEVYALRDECNLLAKHSCFASGLENEFGSMIFAQIKEKTTVNEADSLKLQTEESRLKTEYRRLMRNSNRDDNELFEVFSRLIEIRRDLAASLGYKDYTELGYRLRNRYDYGRDELSVFRKQVQKTVTPVLDDLKRRGVEKTRFPAAARGSGELIAAISRMFHELSEETGNFVEEMIQKELYDLDSRENKRSILWTCCMFPGKKLPFVIGNYSGDGMETGYAVHEFGHGFAFYTAARTQPLYEYHRSSPAVNEIHSKTMELFMYPYLESFVGDRKKEYIRNHMLQQMENLVYRCAIDEFEHRMYDLPRRTRTVLCELWADISQKYMPWIRFSKDDLREGKCWPHQTHIVEVPFYYIEYDIAQISTWEFYMGMRNDRTRTLENYMKLCRAGGSKSFRELLAIAGLSDPFAEGTVERICGPVAEELQSIL